LVLVSRLDCNFHAFGIVGYWEENLVHGIDCLEDIGSDDDPVANGRCELVNPMFHHQELLKVMVSWVNPVELTRFLRVVERVAGVVVLLAEDYPRIIFPSPYFEVSALFHVC
jgi:hypothetical protein